MENPEIFAHRVKEPHKECRLTQTELGDALGLTHKSICTIESGYRAAILEKSILLAKYFDVSTDYLLGLKDQP